MLEKTRKPLPPTFFGKNRIFFGKCRIMPKTLSSSLFSQNVSFLRIVKISHSAKITTVLKKPNSDIACWFTEKTNFKTQKNHLENLTMPKLVKGGPFGLFEN